VHLPIFKFQVEHGKTLYMGGPEQVASEEMFPCLQCHKVCDSKFARDKHIFVKHSMSQQYQNYESPQSSQGVQKLHDNYTSAEHKKVKMFECPYCFTLHANKDRFKKHLGFVQFAYSECQVKILKYNL